MRDYRIVKLLLPEWVVHKAPLCALDCAALTGRQWTDIGQLRAMGLFFKGKNRHGGRRFEKSHTGAGANATSSPSDYIDR